MTGHTPAPAFTPPCTAAALGTSGFTPARLSATSSSSSASSSPSSSSRSPSVPKPPESASALPPSAVLRQPPSKVPGPSRPGRPPPRKFIDDDDDVCFLDECEETYRLPPPKIAGLVDGSSDPIVTLQPSIKEWMILLQRPNMPPIAEVASEELRLAGFRINGKTYAPSRADYFIGLSMQRVDDPDRKQYSITGLPPPPKDSFLEMGYFRWSPDGKRCAFCIYDPLYGLELWMLNPETRHAVCLLPGARLNAVCGDPFTWTPNSTTIVAKFVIEEWRLPKKPAVPRGPIVQENLSNKPAPTRTYQDLLQSRFDRLLFEHYATCQLALVDTESFTMRNIGPPAAFRRASPSPDGHYLLIDTMVPPFPYMMPAGRFPRRVEVWHTSTGTVQSSVAEIPLQDKIPIAFDGVGEGPRGIGWRSDAPSMLYWAEAQDGGDPNREAEIRDAIFTLAAPFKAAPRKLASLPWRYNGILWGSDSTALVSERRYKTRSTRSYLFAPGASDAEIVPGDVAEDGDQSGSEPEMTLGPCCARACDLSQGEAPRRLLFDIPNWEDRYNDPGNVCTMRDEAGKTVLRLIHPRGRSANMTVGAIGRPFLMMQGAGASEDGDRPFLSLFDTVTKEKTLLWRSSPPKFESVSSVLREDEETSGPLEVLIRQEGQKENPNFFVLGMEEATTKAFEILSQPGRSASSLHDDSHLKNLSMPVRAVTAFPHPAPELIDVQREIVNYKRSDGVRLNGSLYLPPGYVAERDGPLPVFIWAYPREYKSAEFAGQMKGSPHRFVRLARMPLYWLTCGYAVLDGPEMPIIGEGNAEANDTYIEQLVSSAEAAVDFLVERGIGERGRIAIGGHSYGAFMAVNLLAHAPKLFCCGVARSGAYNRTLTPFGFQSEERSLWEARDVYQKMSPYMYADSIEVPLLLIHGDADNNAGTFPMQSERLYQALKGHGKVCRFVTLPHEGHGYRARESVMHVLAEMTVWLDKYCKGIDDNYMEEIQ